MTGADAANYSAARQACVALASASAAAGRGRRSAASKRLVCARQAVLFHPMQVHSGEFELRTTGKGTYEITEQVAEEVQASGVRSGAATVFVRHTSCSLVIMENADPSARHDLEEYFDRLVPENAPYFEHQSEGADDMPSHIRMVLTRTSEVIPIASGRMQLGTWQGLFLFEHRRAPHRRRIIVSVIGE